MQQNIVAICKQTKIFGLISTFTVIITNIINILLLNVHIQDNVEELLSFVFVWNYKNIYKSI